MVWKTLDSHPLDVCSLHNVEYEVWGKIITLIGNWFRVSCSSYEIALFLLQYTADRKDGNSAYYAYRRHSVWLYRFSYTNFREYNRGCSICNIITHFFCSIFVYCSRKSVLICGMIVNIGTWIAFLLMDLFWSPSKYHLLLDYWIFFSKGSSHLLINFCWINLD